MTKPPEGLSLKGRALRLLSAREHSRAELQRRLAPHAHDDMQLLALLDELCNQGFLHDGRVVESVIHQRASRYGTQRVVQELQRKGLSQELVDEAAGALHATELERGWTVWQRKYGSAPVDPAEKARQMRFLAARGFSQASIRRILELARQGLTPADL